MRNVQKGLSMKEKNTKGTENERVKNMTHSE